MTLLAGRIPGELEYVLIALSPRGIGGGVWDPNAIRGWHERVASDVMLVMGNLGGTRRGNEY